MTVFTKIRLLWRIAWWRMTWAKRNTHARFTVPGNPKFMGARDAVALIKDGAVVGTSGLGANQWSKIIYWAIRECFEETGHPCDLTVLSIGGQGSRGRVPGSLEELGVEGLCTRFFAGHIETFKAMLRLADKGALELQCIPQGTFALILDAMGRGENFVVTDTGAGTFIDPRVGRGTPVIGDYPQYVEVVDGHLKYSCPPIDVAVFNAPAADRKGNIYVKNCAMIGESYEIAKAARQNGGVVIANVGLLVDEGYDQIFLPAEDIDAIVLDPDTEHSGSRKHRKPYMVLTLNSDVPTDKAIAEMRFINEVVGITPRRKAHDYALARLGAAIFAGHARKGARVDVGIGLPEVVSRLLYEGGLMKDLEMMNESGVLGGLSAPGVFFGAAINPTEIVSSAEAFKRFYDRLDAVILGALEVDSEGNVNVSKRGEGAMNYVGPGGFIDLVTCAGLILFCCSWGNGADIQVRDGRMHVLDPGKAKFIERVEEVTFSGAQALKHNKKVFYVTHVGAFQLTSRGMELIRVMPGIDVQKDILEVCPMRIVLPESGEVPVVDTAVVTGRDFSLAFAQ